MEVGAASSGSGASAAEVEPSTGSVGTSFFEMLLPGGFGGTGGALGALDVDLSCNMRGFGAMLRFMICLVGLVGLGEVFE